MKIQKAKINLLVRDMLPFSCPCDAGQAPAEGNISSAQLYRPPQELLRPAHEAD